MHANSDDLPDWPLESLLTLETATASKFAQPAKDAPSAVQIIQREDIRRHGWRTLAEALASLPGLYAANDGAYDYIGARGFLMPGDYNTRFLLLLDGQRLNDNIYDQAAVGEDFPLDLALIERIEYIPGPGAAVYGANALFGVINVITRRAGSLADAEVAYLADSKGWRRQRATVSRLGGDGGGPDIVASVSEGHRNGRDRGLPGATGLTRADGSASPDGVSHGLGSSTVSRAFISLRQQGASLNAWASRRVVRPDTALYGSNFDDSHLRIADESAGIAASLQTQATPDWQLDGRLAWQQMRYQADYPYRDAGTGAYLNRDNTLGQWWSGELKGIYTGLRTHTVVLGAEFSADQTALQENSNQGGPATPYAMTRQHNVRTGVYVQDEWRLSPHWRLNSGLRHDAFSDAAARTSPRLGLIWHATPDLTLKWLAGQAYRLPNAYERAYPGTLAALANPNLRPETVRQLEMAAEWRPAPGQTVGASLYHYRLLDLIRLVDDGGGPRYQNMAAMRARGIELHATGHADDGGALHASLTFNDAHRADGQSLDNSPLWLARLRASQPLLDARLTGAAEWRASGPRDAVWQGRSARIGVQHTLDLVLTAQRLAPGLELQCRLANVFDRQWPQPAGDDLPVATLPAPGRLWQFRLGYVF